MNVSRSTLPDGVAVLAFDRPGSSANVFDLDTLLQLEDELFAIEKDTTLRGVVLVSAKPRIFVAGADLNALAEDTTERAVDEMIAHGHRVFRRLNHLSIPSIAAIHGACLGGGLELALACDWRIASNDKATKLGLPETQLGILPAWGGSTRLPKLIGLPAALGLILTGKQLAGAQARKLGLVDDVTYSEYLLDTARRFVDRGKRPAPPLRWANEFPFSRLIAMKARRDVLKKTRGHYPAPLKAIDVCVRAAARPIDDGLRLEKAAFLELVRTPECRNLLNVFFLQERAKKLVGASLVDAHGRRQAAPLPVDLPRRVAVIGAGTMGAGIAQWVSARHLPVKLKDVSPDALARGLHAIGKLYAEGVKRRVFTQPEATAGFDRITPIHTDVPLRDVDLVIEAALEKLDVKQQVFRDLEARVSDRTILATNTSALSIDAIAAGLAHPERVLGLHFFNPVHRMQLVEIVRGTRTSAAALATALQFTKAIGKLPVIVKDSPGFLVNRILLPYMVEAVWLFTEGVPAPEIDWLMLEFGMPMGPLRLADEVGLDVAQHVAKDLERRLPGAVPINDTLVKMVAKGWLGKKSGRGFYVYTRQGEEPAPQSEIGFLQAEKPRPSSDEVRTERMVLIMINEAARVLAEGVVESPEDVDFGMIMGTGWAPFRGGPLRYADTLGAAHVVRRLATLSREVAPHFAPCVRLCEMAREGWGFYENPKPKESPPYVDTAPLSKGDKDTRRPQPASA